MSFGVELRFRPLFLSDSDPDPETMAGSRPRVRSMLLYSLLDTRTDTLWTYSVEHLRAFAPSSTPHLLPGTLPLELTFPLLPLLPLLPTPERLPGWRHRPCPSQGLPLYVSTFLDTLSASPISWRTTPLSGLRPLPSCSARLTSRSDCSSCVQSGHARSTRSGQARRRSGGASGSSPRATSQSPSVRPPPAPEADPLVAASTLVRVR